MKESFYQYLNSLNKEELINLIYNPAVSNKRQKNRYTCVSNRRIALRVSYDGINYSGVQCDSNKLSITECLENALSYTGIGRNLVFCGRTDAGVSAINMIVSLDVISRLEIPNKSFIVEESDYDEYPYDIILNKVLPADIRATGWAPVSDSFNARYDCIQRHYRYFFFLADKNLEIMKETAEEIAKLNNFYKLSTHSNPRAIYDRKIDEISICKVDNKEENDCLKIPDHSKSNNSNKCVDFKQAIRNIAIKNNKCKDEYVEVSNISIAKTALNQNEFQKERTKQLRMLYNNKDITERETDRDLYYLDIKANGFLHNMVRKIYWVIESCGKGNKYTLQNVELADPLPLVFVGCKFKIPLNFISNKYSEQPFKEKTEKSMILAAIAELRYKIYDTYKF